MRGGGGADFCRQVFSAGAEEMAMDVRCGLGDGGGCEAWDGGMEQGMRGRQCGMGGARNWQRGMGEERVMKGRDEGRDTGGVWDVRGKKSSRFARNPAACKG